MALCIIAMEMGDDSQLYGFCGTDVRERIHLYYLEIFQKTPAPGSLK
jgi:hypothetical protein